MKGTPKGRPSGEFEFQLAPLLAAIRALPPRPADGRLKHLLAGLATYWIRNPDCAEIRDDGRVMLGPPKEHIADAARRSLATITRAIRAVRHGGGGGALSNWSGAITPPIGTFSTPKPSSQRPKWRGVKTGRRGVKKGCQKRAEGCHVTPLFGARTSLSEFLILKEIRLMPSGLVWGNIGPATSTVANLTLRKAAKICSARPSPAVGSPIPKATSQTCTP